MKPMWKKYLLYGSAVIIGGILLFFLEETIRLKNTGFEGKSLWQWMELLIIPSVLGIGAFYLERSERAVDRKVAEDRAKLERELATDRQQEAALQAYLNYMADLLLNRGLLMSENEEARNVARIQTLTILRVLDARRKGLVVQFLYEAGLIKPPSFSISLRDAPLQNADLRGANLDSADLSTADLSGADLSGAVLFGAKLNGARLVGCNMSHTTLRSANLQSADLTGANLYHANTMYADFNFANLEGADLTGTIIADFAYDDDPGIHLKGATMPDGTKHH